MQEKLFILYFMYFNMHDSNTKCKRKSYYWRKLDRDKLNKTLLVHNLCLFISGIESILRILWDNCGWLRQISRSKQGTIDAPAVQQVVPRVQARQRCAKEEGEMTILENSKIVIVNELLTAVSREIETKYMSERWIYLIHWKYRHASRKPAWKPAMA